MADEVKTATVEPVVDPQKPETKPDLTIDELKTELDKALRTVHNKEEEAARVHAKLEKFEQEELKRKEAELSEMDKLKLRAETAEKEKADLLVQIARRDVGAKIGLPAVLIDRIRGETPEEMEADAKKLLDELPKPAKVSTVAATNPAGGQLPQETREQTLKRLHLA